MWNERPKHTSVKEEIREREREKEPSVSFKVLSVFFFVIFKKKGKKEFGLISTTFGFSKLAPNERLK